MPYFKYVDHTDSNLICCICRMPFIDPVTTRLCSHTFCRACISQALNHSLQCPVDRLALSVDDLEQADPIVRSLVDELKVWCPTEGCTHLCQRHLLQGHLAESCEFVLVPCADESCKEKVVRKGASDICIHTPIVCSQCETEIPSAEYEDHTATCSNPLSVCELCSTEIQLSSRQAHAGTCQRALVPCVHSCYGCVWSGERRLLATHTSSCPYEAIKGFFTIHDASTQALKEENMLLRAKVDALQGHLRSSNRELQAAKIALGPWYLSAAARPSSELPNHIQNSTATTSSHIIYPSPTPGPRSSNDTSSFDDFASYFPQETVSTNNANLGPSHHTAHERRSRTSPNISHNWDSTNPTARCVARDLVAPVDLSASLEGSLNGLRESMVTLSATVDSVARRNDIALTNETLRLNEEVMSLRAHVHGLRMQVHAVMMDRNTRVTSRMDEAPEAGAWIPTRFSQVPGQPPLSITKL